MLKRTLCALLALICVIGILPVTALAAEETVVNDQLTAFEVAPAAENGLIVEEATTSDSATNTYYADSSYWKYYNPYYYNYYEFNESENNNSRSKADVLPASSYSHIHINGYVHSSNDSKDYYKIKVTSAMYLKLLFMSGFSYKQTQVRLYDSSGDLLKTAPKKSTWQDDNNNSFAIYYFTYVLNPGTYYIRVYEPSKTVGNTKYIYSENYEMNVHLYPRLAKPVVTMSNNKDTGKPIVSWNSVSGAQYYKVYRATSKSGTYYEKDVVYGTSWTDTAAKAGKTYYYKVQAFSDAQYYDESNNQSSKSAYKSRTCDCARPDVDISLKNGKPRLTWDKVTGAKEYKVYRATSKNGTYKLMKTTTSTSYTNTSAKSGRTYYYKVKAIASKSAANSAYSYIDSITTP